MEGDFFEKPISELLSTETQTITDWAVEGDFNYWYKVPGHKSVSKRVFNQVTKFPNLTRRRLLHIIY